MVAMVGYGQQSQAVKDQKKAYEVLKSLPGGAVATGDGSWTMTATINGKPWKAIYMYPAEASDRISGHAGDEMIGLPYSRAKMEVGKKEVFAEHNATDLFLKDDIGFYGGRSGEMVITKVTGLWIEGTFHFTATTKLSNTAKPVEVTNGFFRIKLAK